MKRLLGIAAAVFLLGLTGAAGWLPWWSLAFWGGLAGWAVARGAAQGFWGGFIGGLFLWLVFALVRDFDNGGILSAHIGALLMGVPRWGLWGITGLLGGLLGGMGALTGYQARAFYRHLRQ
jgi:hypothetical protein